jgi:hypothetical protein
LNVVLGAWLIVSAFAWAHGFDELLVSVLVGALLFASGTAGFVAEDLRFVEAMLAGLLLIAAFVLPHQLAGTPWNDAIVAVTVMALSLAPEERVRTFWQKHAHIRHAHR